MDEYTIFAIIVVGAFAVCGVVGLIETIRIGLMVVWHMSRPAPPLPAPPSIVAEPKG